MGIDIKKKEMHLKKDQTLLSLLVIILLALVFNAGQEIVAISGMQDDYNFLLRSKSLTIDGSYLAPIKEILYPLYILLSRSLGLSLRTFESLSYGIACYFLWQQTSRLIKSELIGWLTILPLTAFSFQYPVFRHVTYDSLQLILTPLSISTSILLFRRNADRYSLIAASCVVGAHVLTRPEGILFMISPIITVFFVIVRNRISMRQFDGFWYVSRKLLVIVVVPFLVLQAVSAYNMITFGFWAPTIIASKDFQACLSNLMKISPMGETPQPFSPFSKASMELARNFCPSFRQIYPYFLQNIDGKGWSSNACKGYNSFDGSLEGAHFQWALYDAGASVANEKPVKMLAFFRKVSDELESAFDHGAIQKRYVFSTALGPSFSLFNQRIQHSFFRILSEMFERGESPEVSAVNTNPGVEFDFNRLALRQTALLQTDELSFNGWVLDPNIGLANSITLDHEARIKGTVLHITNRPDVARTLLKKSWCEKMPAMAGFRIDLRGIPAGNLIINYPQKKVVVPLAEICALKTSEELIKEGVRIYIDQRSNPGGSAGVHSVSFSSYTSNVIHFYVKTLISFIPIFLIVIFVISHKTDTKDKKIPCETILFIITVTSFILLPKALLLAAIDSVMFPGDESRYLAAGAFVVWYTATYLAAVVISLLLKKVDVTTLGHRP